MLSTGNIIALLVLSALCFAFVVFLWKDGTGTRYRRDMREEKKAGDTERDPFILDKDQQAAELQVGPREERRHPNRFVPDQPQH